MLAPIDGTLAFVLCGSEVLAGHHHHQGSDQAERADSSEGARHITSSSISGSQSPISVHETPLELSPGAITMTSIFHVLNLSNRFRYSPGVVLNVLWNTSRIDSALRKPQSAAILSRLR
jgi:hypothetical protein